MRASLHMLGLALLVPLCFESGEPLTSTSEWTCDRARLQAIARTVRAMPEPSYLRFGLVQRALGSCDGLPENVANGLLIIDSAQARGRDMHLTSRQRPGPQASHGFFAGAFGCEFYQEPTSDEVWARCGRPFGYPREIFDEAHTNYFLMMLHAFLRVQGLDDTEARALVGIVLTPIPRTRIPARFASGHPLEYRESNGCILEIPLDADWTMAAVRQAIERAIEEEGRVPELCTVRVDVLEVGHVYDLQVGISNARLDVQFRRGEARGPAPTIELHGGPGELSRVAEPLVTLPGPAHQLVVRASDEVRWQQLVDVLAHVHDACQPERGVECAQPWAILELSELQRAE